MLFNHLGFIFNSIGSLLYPKKIQQALCKFITIAPKNTKVLDIGSGTGVMSKIAYNCNHELNYFAVDPSIGMLKYQPQYIKTEIASAENLPFADNSIDIIIIGEALHHFSNINLSIKEIKRVLTKNGRIFIYEFNVSTFRGKILSTIEKILGEPGNFFTPHDLQKLLNDYGLKVKYTNYSWRYIITTQVAY